jgi:hypothetical protein
MESKRGYDPKEFNFLIGTRHVDPKNGLPYVIEKVGKHRNRLVTVSRQMKNLQTGLSTGSSDVVHALDALSYYLICNPEAPCPLFNGTNMTVPKLNQYLSDLIGVKHTGQGKAKRKRKRSNTLFNDNAGVNHDHLDSVPASTGDSIDGNYNFRRSKRLRQLSTKVFLMNTKKDPLNKEINACDVPIPRTYEEAMRSSFRQYWIKAIEEEIAALKKRGVFLPTNLPDGKIVLPHLWAFAVKADSTGKVVRFKARLTARRDQYDASDPDFQELFSPVVSWEGVRTYFALTALSYLA